MKGRQGGGASEKGSQGDTGRGKTSTLVTGTSLSLREEKGDRRPTGRRVGGPGPSSRGKTGRVLVGRRALEGRVLPVGLGGSGLVMGHGPWPTGSDEPLGPDP